MVGLRALLGALLLLAAVPQATATPPCWGPDYEVSYAPPIWAVQLRSSWIPDARIWLELPNRTFVPVPIQDRVGEDEPFAHFDRDEDGLLTVNDTILLWDPDRRERTVHFGLGPTADQVIPFPVNLEVGYVRRCAGTYPPWETSCALLIGAIGIAGSLVVVLWRRSRRRRRMPY